MNTPASAAVLTLSTPCDTLSSKSGRHPRAFSTRQDAAFVPPANDGGQQLIAAEETSRPLLPA
jgi:hypothetical protein